MMRQQQQCAEQEEEQEYASSSSSCAEKEVYSSSRRGTLRLFKRAKGRTAGLDESPVMIIVAIHRPQFRNAINDDVYEDLIDVMDETVQDPSIGGLVLTGSGPFFTSGADLRASSFGGPSPLAEEGAAAQHQKAGDDRPPTCDRPPGRFMLRLLNYPKVVGAAVNGPAVGIGTTLLFHCDLVFASTTATFWAPFTRLALVPEFCSSVTFPQTMGLARANEMLLLGKEIDAKTAVEWNICSRVIKSTNDESATNPFHPTSLANIMADEVESKLLALPRGLQTSEYFVSLTRHARQRREGLRKVCLEELALLDERSAAGEVQEAVRVVLDAMKAKKETTKKIRQKHLQSRL